jgi:DNA-binding PucR family transcriptional regulator
VGAAGRHGVCHLADLAGETALAAQPALAGLLSESLPGALRPADEFHRELVSTALAYLDHGQRLDHAAAALHVHPNTVRYRLRRLASLGVEVGEPLTVLEKLRLWWALRTWLD